VDAPRLAGRSPLFASLAARSCYSSPSFFDAWLGNLRLRPAVPSRGEIRCLPSWGEGRQPSSIRNGPLSRRAVAIGGGVKKRAAHGDISAVSCVQAFSPPTGPGLLCAGQRAGTWRGVLPRRPAANLRPRPACDEGFRARSHERLARETRFSATRRERSLRRTLIELATHALIEIFFFFFFFFCELTKDQILRALPQRHLSFGKTGMNRAFGGGQPRIFSARV